MYDSGPVRAAAAPAARGTKTGDVVRTKRAQPGWFMAARSGPEYLKLNKYNYNVSYGRFCGFCRNTSALVSLFSNDFCSFLQTSCRNVINLLQDDFLPRQRLFRGFHASLSVFKLIHVCCAVIIKRMFLPPLAELFCF